MSSSFGALGQWASALRDRRFERKGLFFGMMIALMIMGPISRAAIQVIPVAVTTCATCNSQSTLMAAAVAYATQYYGPSSPTPPGYVGQISTPLNGGLCSPGQNGATTIIVVSTYAPLSGAFYPCYRQLHGTSFFGVVPINANTDAGAIAADNSMFHRSAKLGLIQLPPNLPLTGGSDPVEVIGAYLQGPQGLPMIGVPTFNLWRGLFSGSIGAVEKGTFTNMTTGETFTLWSGDTVKVTDSNGYTALFQWIPSVSPPWVYKSGSMHDNKGNSVPDGTSTPISKTGGSPQPIGAITITYPSGPTVTITPWYNNPTPTGSATVGDPITDLPDAPPTNDVAAGD